MSRFYVFVRFAHLHRHSDWRTIIMSQQSGNPFAALIRVNTVVQAVVGNGNRDIRGETRVEYQGRYEGQKAGRYQSKMRETVQSQNTMIKQRKMRTLRNVSRGNTRLRGECVCVWVWLKECHRWASGELSIRVLVRDDGKWSSEREVNTRVMMTSGDDQGEPQRPDSYTNTNMQLSLWNFKQLRNIYHVPDLTCWLCLANGMNKDINMFRFSGND